MFCGFWQIVVGGGGGCWGRDRCSFYQVVVVVPMSHDPCDVWEQTHPGVLGVFVPHVHTLQVGPDSVQEDIGHHPKIVSGNTHVTVVATKSQ